MLSTPAMIAIAVGVLVLLIILYEYHKSHKAKAAAAAAKPPPPPPCSATAPCPKPQSCVSGACVPAPRPIAALSVPNQTDCGYPSGVQGWYDIQGQGVQNDYCRWVGSPAWFSCALAGTATAANSGSQYTPSSQLIDPKLPHTALASGDVCFSGNPT